MAGLSLRNVAVFVATSLFFLAAHSEGAYSQNLQAESVEDLVRGLQSLQEGGSDLGLGSDDANGLDAVRRRGAEKILGLDVGSVVNNAIKLKPSERFVANSFCSGDTSARVLGLLSVIDNFSPVERDYCVRANQFLTLFGYDLFEGLFSPELLVDGRVQEDYRLGVGDEIVVTFVGQEPKRKTVKVDREGLILIDPLRPIVGAGRSIGDVAAEISREVSAAFLGTEAFASLGAVRQISVVVVGQVPRPGRQVMTALSSIRDAIGLAGGVSKNGSLRKVRLVRDGAAQTLDLYGLLTGTIGEDVFVRDGDRILVEPIGSTIAISGLVVRPGVFELDETRTSISAQEALAMAGGTIRPRGNRLKRLRIDDRGAQAVLVRDVADFELTDGDLLVVEPRAQRESGAVEVAGHVRTPGLRSLTEAPTVRALIGEYTELGNNPYLPLMVLHADAGQNGRTLYAINGVDVMSGAVDYELREGDRLIILGRDDIRYLSGDAVLSVLAGDEAREQSSRDAAAGDGSLATGLAGVGGPFASLTDSLLSRQEADNTEGLAPTLSLDHRCQSLERLRLIQANSPSKRASTSFFLDSAPGRFDADWDQPDIANGDDGLPSSETDNRNARSAARAQQAGCRDIYEANPDVLPFLVEHSVSLVGEIRAPGFYPVTSGSSLQTILGVAGGPTVAADIGEVEIARADATRGGGIIQVSLDADEAQTLSPGDTVTINSKENSIEGGPVVLRGEFVRPGAYPIVSGERLSQVMARAGGLTATAYPYGAVFMRVSVRRAEKLAQKRLSRELNSALAAAAASRRLESTAITALAGLSAQLSDTPAIGRVVIEADPTVLQVRPELDLVLQPGDVIVIPKRPSSVLVTGDVLNPGAMQFVAGTDVEKYVSQAGGYGRAADRDKVFIVYPNGVAQPVSTSPFRYSSIQVPPGTTIVVPKDAAPFNFLSVSREVASVVSQLAITAASLAVINN